MDALLNDIRTDYGNRFNDYNNRLASLENRLSSLESKGIGDIIWEDVLLYTISNSAGGYIGSYTTTKSVGAFVRRIYSLVTSEGKITISEKTLWSYDTSRVYSNLATGGEQTSEYLHGHSVKIGRDMAIERYVWFFDGQQVGYDSNYTITLASGSL